MESPLLKPLSESLQSAIANPTVRKIALPAFGVFLVLQIYFFRELLAAELLFGLAFTIILFLVGIFYLVGSIGERGLDGAEIAARAIGRTARRGYVSLEEFSKKSLRRPESAQ